VDSPVASVEAPGVPLFFYNDLRAHLPFSNCQGDGVLAGGHEFRLFAWELTRIKVRLIGNAIRAHVGASFSLPIYKLWAA